MTTTDTESTFCDFALALISLVDTPDGTDRAQIILDVNQIISNEITDPETKRQMHSVLHAVRFHAERSA